MTSFYFHSDPKMRVAQTSVSVPSTNGLSYNPGQQIEFFIDPAHVEFFDPASTYLNFDVEIDKGNLNTLLMLDPFIGGQRLIKTSRSALARVSS